MAASVTVLWLIAAFLGGAFSLTCYHCNTPGSSCEENQKLCEAPNDVCITTVTDVRQDKGPQLKPLAGAQQRQLVKSCGEKKFCNQTYSMTFSSTKLYASTACCESDKCKTIMPEVKIQDKETQQKCPNCPGLSDKCNDAETISCFGAQNKCVTFTSKNASISNVIHTWKGCVTDNVCSMKIIPTLPVNHILDTQPHCDRAPSLLPGMLAPMAFGLALLKLLL